MFEGVKALSNDWRSLTLAWFLWLSSKLVLSVRGHTSTEGNEDGKRLIIVTLVFCTISMNELWGSYHVE